jgi:hypothetical protein
MMPDNRKEHRGTVRSACYDQIRACMSSQLKAYYSEHPERLMDERSVDKIAMMRKALACILEVLDDYEITATEEK